ncbi:MAG: hypothetical protein JNN15_18660, partial [Blastocatellia bacterium]|nr:hypothetical protein [Blastocatellia bacterium]
MKRHFLFFSVLFVTVSLIYPIFSTVGAGGSDVQAEAQKFIDEYTTKWNNLRTESVLAEWNSNIRIVEGDDTNAKATKAAQEKLAAFTGSRNNIEAAKTFLAKRSNLTPLQIKQLEAVLHKAGENPETVAPLVKKRIDAEIA